MTAVELLPPGTGNHDERWRQLRRESAPEIAVENGIRACHAEWLSTRHCTIEPL